jgi:hypothetical protein
MALLRKATRLLLTWSISFGLVIFFLRDPSVIHALQRAENDNGISSTSIRLVLQTSKKRYRTGEPIEIVGYLENVSQDKTYYVGNDLGQFFIIQSFHYIDLKIIDRKGREVPIGRGAATSLWKQSTTVTEKLAQAYIQLRPGMIFGQKDAGNITLRPGQYRLIATYREIEALDWTEMERKALPIQVWTQSLVSNTVTITVVP